MWLVLFAVFTGSYLTYFAYLKLNADKPWRLKIDPQFYPPITVLVPVHNEERTIQKKLENLAEVSYPKEKIEVIVADDASQDETLTKVEGFMNRNPDLNIRIVKQNSRAGKSAALNKALAVSTQEIVIVSDVDTWWPPDVLQEALPYLSDPKVGAVTGRGVNRNIDPSWVTKAENTYLHFAFLLRLGESKIHSTIRFEGGFCAYKKDAFEEFDCETGSDDSGTALKVVQHDYRTILVPDAVFYTQFPTRLIGKLKIKARRANQLISLWVKCFRFMLKRRLLLPETIAIPEIMLSIFNPIILLALIVTAATAVVLSPLSLFSLGLILFVTGLLLFARKIFFEMLLDNLILFYALIAFLFGQRYIVWEKTGP